MLTHLLVDCPPIVFGDMKAKKPPKETLCGRRGESFTEDPDNVTCRWCRKVLRMRGAPGNKPSESSDGGPC